ncbi:DUF3024 domain-containing protein [Colwellia hornerae]|uniref:DUF3024 domain-containing protein n=1 Tax=Colwellia hornerae TaxID=89402 RepID=A0A5C6Q2B2_9GAMM|nr:DUF3024 domain-containing protein [Colwellia hornerae]TWX45639.1 DUF3024 domain-containing protein [Colwellia hornerae]TWX53597.1 DUF3024 domain-containing protein [Colwellia hornerae]TWX62973.1 DUF3024 domain-containing protein [Colwellia hornerae]
MAISEFELYKVEKLAKSFCSVKSGNFSREQLYIDYKIEGQTLYFFEVRPMWNDPTKNTEILVAKFTYVKKDKIWKLYWLRQNQKWQAYEPDGINLHLEPLLEIVQEDKQACFWG